MSDLGDEKKDAMRITINEEKGRQVEQFELDDSLDETKSYEVVKPGRLKVCIQAATKALAEREIELELTIDTIH